MGKEIDYADGKNWETIGMITDLDVLHYFWKGNLIQSNIAYPLSIKQIKDLSIVNRLPCTLHRLYSTGLER
jgi:hypothetical protein